MPNAYTGRLIDVGFAKETTRGTAAAVTKYVPRTALGFAPVVEKIVDESALGTIVSGTQKFKVNEMGSGNIDGNVGIESIGLVLLSLFGNVSSAQTVGLLAYEHDFTLAETNSHQSLTIGVNDRGQSLGEAFPNAIIESITISASENSFVTMSVSFLSKIGSTVTHTATYVADKYFLAHHLSMKLASTYAGLGAASVVCIQSLEISIAKNPANLYCLGNLGPQDFANQDFTISGSFTARWTDSTHKTTAFGTGTKAMRVTMLDSTTTIGNADNPTLEFDFAEISLSEFSPTRDNGSVVTQTLTFSGGKSIADNLAITARLINETTSY